MVIKLHVWGGGGGGKIAKTTQTVRQMKIQVTAEELVRKNVPASLQRTRTSSGTRRSCSISKQQRESYRLGPNWLKGGVFGKHRTGLDEKKKGGKIQGSIRGGGDTKQTIQPNVSDVGSGMISIIGEGGGEI